MIRRATARGVWIPAVAVLAGCGSDPSGPDGGNGGGNPVQTTSVTVVDSNFDPAAIQVAPGATVTWTWSGTSQSHNVIWASGGLAASPTQSSGTYQATMPTTAGELTYYCNIHGSPTSGMRGTVRVQ